MSSVDAIAGDVDGVAAGVGQRAPEALNVPRASLNAMPLLPPFDDTLVNCRFHAGAAAGDVDGAAGGVVDHAGGDRVDDRIADIGAGQREAGGGAEV